MQKDIEPMDILMAPTHDNIVLTKISKWFNASCLNKDQTVTITFKKYTCINSETIYSKYQPTSESSRTQSIKEVQD